MPKVLNSEALKSKTLKRTVVILASLALLVVAYTLFWYQSASTAALPQLDGTIALRGLSANVNVVYDAQGVPNINANSMEDLMFAQGYITAQDRLWQMDAFRRFAAGELSAAFGSSMVETDKRQRLLGMRAVAQHTASQLSPRDRAYFEAYARGINAYIDDHQYKLPLEFRVLRYFPRAWTVEDSFLVGTMMAEMLTHGDYLREITRERIAARIGLELAADLYPNVSFRDMPPVETAAPGELPVEPPLPDRSSLPRDSQSVLALLVGITSEGLADERPLPPGSNNWVLSGANTVTGRPLLSNDMHLAHRLPNIWYEAHLTSGDFDVAGVSLPGMPAIIVGHNRRIAWGFTNVMGDVQDTYVEQFNDRGEYLTPAGWQAPEIRKETIAVKRGRDISLDVIVTRHGPIITPMLKNETRQISMRWTLYEAQAFAFPFFEVNAATNWQDFRQAFSKFGVPGQNVVYADVDGHIGYQATGLYPIRNGNGLLPAIASDDSHEWTGWVPFEQLPFVYDPPTGIIATANQRITPDNYAYSLSNDYGGPYRAQRINRVLRSGKKFSVADMLALQTDVQSELDRNFAVKLAYAVDRSRNVSEKARKAADLLRGFDGRMEKDSAAAAIERVARQSLRKRLLTAKLGELAPEYQAWMESVWLENMIETQPQRWLPQGMQDWTALLAACVEDAVTDRRAPKNSATWNYGKTFPLEISHDVLGNIPFIGRKAKTGSVPQSGDGDTVKQVGRTFGPSERFTADLSNWDASTLNIVNGQSGHLRSPHFNDQFNSWLSGTTYPLPFTSEAVQKAKAHSLTLVPEK